MRTLVFVALIVMGTSSWSTQRDCESRLKSRDVLARVQPDLILIGDSVAEMDKLPAAHQARRMGFDSSGNQSALVRDDGTLAAGRSIGTITKSARSCTISLSAMAGRFGMSTGVDG